MRAEELNRRGITTPRAASGTLRRLFGCEEVAMSAMKGDGWHLIEHGGL